MRIPTPVADLAVPTIVAAALIFFGLANPVFLSWSNLGNIVLQASIIGIISLGMTLVIIAGGIDLSVGGIVALSAIVMAKVHAAGWSSGGSFAVSLLVGFACGIVNGLLVGYFKVPSFISTLGMMGIARGLALSLSEGRPLSTIGSLSDFLGSGQLVGVPVPIVLFLGASVTLGIVLRGTIWGVHLYALGGNNRAAWISGVKVKQYVAGTLAVSGLLAGFAGVVLAGRLGSAQPLAGTLYELDAITAAVLGGATLSGGRGSAYGTVAGVILLTAIRNAMVLINLSPYYHQIVIGTVLVMVLLANFIRRGNADALAGPL